VAKRHRYGNGQETVIGFEARNSEGLQSEAGDGRTVQSPDGRTLAVEETGDPAGRPVLVHNGTPNSRLIYARSPPTRKRAAFG
jgi:hypothetical protein